MLVYRIVQPALIRLEGESAALVFGTFHIPIDNITLVKILSGGEAELVEDGRKLRGLAAVPRLVGEKPEKPAKPAKSTRGEKIAAAAAERKAQGLCRRCEKKVAVVDGEKKALCPRHLKEAQAKMTRVWKARDAAVKARKTPKKKTAKKAAKK